MTVSDKVTVVGLAALGFMGGCAYVANAQTQTVPIPASELAASNPGLYALVFVDVIFVGFLIYAVRLLAPIFQEQTRDMSSALREVVKVVSEFRAEMRAWRETKE